jgi:hypothetical protein
MWGGKGKNIAAYGGDWRSKSLAPMLMFSTMLNGFYFANRVLAVRASPLLEVQN